MQTDKKIWMEKGRITSHSSAIAYAIGLEIYRKLILQPVRFRLYRDVSGLSIFSFFFFLFFPSARATHIRAQSGFVPSLICVTSVFNQTARKSETRKRLFELLLSDLIM